jgi:MFS family permease
MTQNRSIKLTVLVAALGYFVDIYDLLLFGIVRVPSLRAIGVPEQDLLEVGIQLINSQMAGLLVGGIIWGIWGDKKGRLSVLFSSILLYSLANIANAFVTTPTAYAALRFFAGIGLAGELGAAITLVSELMSKETRGIGTTVVASVGILGAVFASLVGDLFDWKTAYIVGGGMGLALLLLRLKMFESGLYENLEKATHVRKGDFFMLFRSMDRFWKYARCILIGVPIWFVIGILITFSPELAKELNVQEPIRASTAIMTAYLGLSLGDLCSGLLSQFMRSRRKVVGIFLALTLGGMIAYANARGVSAAVFYALCLFLGFAVGYWAVFVTVGAEQFGTNLRATVATTVPNFVRGSVVPVTLSFQYFSKTLGWSLVSSAMTVGAITLAIASLALWKMQETFAKDLDYLEEHDSVLTGQNS